MKKALPFIFMAALTASSFFASAQLRKIPAEVTNRFTEKYPLATNIEWKDKLSGFTASYSLDEVDYVSSFTNKGIWESTEQVIPESDLPEVIKDSYSKSKFSEWTIGTIHKIEMPDNVIQYRVEAIKSDIQKKNLYYTPKGKLLKDKITL